MAPPSYPDINKAGREIFSKHYHHNNIVLDLKTKSANGVEFTAGGSSNMENGKVDGKFETKYSFKQHGLTFTERWNTSNELSIIADVKDRLINGMKLTFDSRLNPQTGAKSGKVKAEYKHDLVTVNSDVDINLGGPLVNASAVVGHKGWLAGYQLAFDTGKSKLTKNNFCLGYSSGDFVLHTNVNDGQVFGGSVYQKVNPNLDTAINLGWTASKNETSFGIGCKYTLDKNASLRAKVNNSSQVGLGYQQKLRDGVTITLSTLIDGKNVQQGGHKLGLALELEA